MNNTELYTRIAREFHQRLGKRSHMTVSRSEITEEARRIANNPSRRVNGSGMGAALKRQGLRSYPSLDGEHRAMRVRILRLGTVANSVVDLVVLPTPTNDKELGVLVKKLKNEWNWGAQLHGEGHPS